MLNIYYGREDLDKEGFLFSEIGKTLEAIREENEKGGLRGCCKRVFLIVPDQYTLQAERNAFYYLKAPGFLELEVLSLSRLRQKVLTETGSGELTYINKNGRQMLLSWILREEAKRLKTFPGLVHAPVFAEMMNDLIAEMKMYNTTADEIRQAAEESDDAVLKAKLSDICAVFQNYEDRIRGKYIDTEDFLSLFMSKIRESDILRESEIWMYGFDYLTP
ncbi:MAG: hypothetical protein LBT34_01005, partial [Clostridiales Family XIII bacterium]|nr:hypothetical protein [Clostridiales Family XIII bacterium]